MSAPHPRRDGGGSLNRGADGFTPPSRFRPIPNGSRRISVDLPEWLFEDLLVCANEDRVSAARWIASATREAVRGHQGGFRFDTHGLPDRESREAAADAG